MKEAAHRALQAIIRDSHRARAHDRLPEKARVSEDFLITIGIRRPKKKKREEEQKPPGVSGGVDD